MNLSDARTKLPNTMATQTLNTSTCVRFVKREKEAPESYLLIIHFSERVRGCCPSCACLRLCRRAALQIHTIGPLRPGVLHSPNNQSAKKKYTTICGEKTDLSRFSPLSVSRSLFSTPPQKTEISGSSLVFSLYTSCSPLFLSLSREIFLLPLPATSSISPPTLSPSPPPPPPPPCSH